MIYVFDSTTVQAFSCEREQDARECEKWLDLQKADHFRMQVQPWQNPEVMPEDAAGWEVPWQDGRHAPPIDEHFMSASEAGLPAQQLRIEVMYEGWQYTLTDGQRMWLRNKYDMLPSRVVEIREVETYPGTQVLKSFKLQSVVHTASNQKGWMLTAARITEGWRFFKESKELEEENVIDEWGKKVEKKSTSTAKPASAESLIDQLAKELSGESVGAKVSITKVEASLM